MLDRRHFIQAAGATAVGGGLALLTAPAAFAAQKTLPTKYQEQPNFYYCGPTAVAIAISAKADPPSLDTIAGELGTNDNGTSFGAISPVLSNRIPGATYRDQWMANSSATKADADLLWERATTNVDEGFATVCNWWVMPGEYPDWGGNTGEIFHFVTCDGYDPDKKTLRIADPAGSTLTPDLPSHHWLSAQQVATYCAGRGYFW